MRLLWSDLSADFASGEAPIQEDIDRYTPSIHYAYSIKY